MLRRGRSGAISLWRCRTISSTDPTRPSRPRARSSSGLAELDEAARRNRDAWTRSNEQYTAAAAPRRWAAEEITWGVFDVPESGVDALGEVSGLDVVELGCGTAYFSAWLAKRGARPVGVDVTPAQLDTARRMMVETGIAFPLVAGDAAETGRPAARLPRRRPPPGSSARGR